MGFHGKVRVLLAPGLRPHQTPAFAAGVFHGQDADEQEQEGLHLQPEAVPSGKTKQG